MTELRQESNNYNKVTALVPNSKNQENENINEINEILTNVLLKAGKHVA